MDAELQQRAVEYGGLATRPAVAKQNVLPMPRWEHRKSLLMRRLAEKQVRRGFLHAGPAVSSLRVSVWLCVSQR